MKHESKLELALDIVFRQRNAGIRFAYVCADGLYGNSSDFCRDIREMLEHVLPKKAGSRNDVMEGINARHCRRKKAIISKAKRQASQLDNPH